MHFQTMKSIFGVGPLCLTLLFLTAMPASACAEHEKNAAIRVGHPVLAAINTTTRPTAIFMTLTNGQKSPDVLTAVKTAACGRAELHDHIRDGDVMRMRQVQNIPLNAGATVTLKPGGLHIMCFDPVLPQTPGQNFPMTLTFKTAGDVKVTGKIVTFAEALTAGKADAHGMDHTDHADHHALTPANGNKVPAAK